MAQLVIPRPHARTELTTPLELPNLAAWYSLDGGAGDSSYLIDGSNRLMLVADRSGNSAVNGLALNGVNGNYASTPDSAAVSVTGNISLLVMLTPTAALTTTGTYISKYSSATGQRSYRLIVTSGPNLQFQYTNNGTTGIAATSSTTITSTTFTPIGLRADYNSSTGKVDFYTSPDFVTWTALGTQQTITAGAIFDSTTALFIGCQTDGGTNVPQANISRAQVYNGIFGAGGTLVFDANFATAAKLASTFTESSSNAATVTVTTTGDTGARICGARDLYQGTQAKQPIFSVSGGFNIATFDGSNDYLKAAPFSLSQPESIYFAGSQVSWTLNDFLIDGNANDTAIFKQTATTPGIVFFAGASLVQNDNCTVGVKSVLRGVANGNSSVFAVNRTTATTGAGGASNMGGFTLGAHSDGGNAGNITFSEAIIRANADDSALQDRITAFLMRKWGVA